MKIETSLPITTLFFKHWAPDNSEMGVVIAKARFQRAIDGWFHVTPNAPDLRLDDQFTGDASFSALMHEQDIAPTKTATDLIIHAIARSPEGREMTDWPVRISIADRLTYEFRVQGPSRWYRGGPALDWQREAVTPVASVPIDYAHAFGGVLRDDAGGITDVWAGNPAGVGYLNKAWLDRRGDPFAAPQIGLLAELMGRDPLAEMSVHGTAPIAKAWTPRRALAGTFDATWQRDRHPRMPDDYDFGFWNAAPRALQITPFLSGAETLTVSGVSAAGPVDVTLPGGRLALDLGDTAPRLCLDTVEIDLTSADPTEHSIYLTWRGTVTDPDRYRAATVIRANAATREDPA